MNNLSYRSKLLLHFLPPVAAVALLLVVALSFFHAQQLAEAFDDHGQASSRQLAEFARHIVARDALPGTELVQILLDEKGVRSASLYGPDQRRLAHAGPQTLVENTSLVLDQWGHKVAGDETSLFVTPIDDPDGTNVLGWAVVEMSQDHLWLAIYRTLLSATVLGLAALLAGMALIMVIGRRIFAPLDRIGEALRQCAAGDLNTSLTDISKGPFSDLAKSIEMTSAHLRESQQAMQGYIDQATQDLRETLETVEVQNVELSLARKEALEASRAKSEFLANTSHEIRTPINGIIGFTGLLLKTAVNTQQKEYLHTIQKSSQGLLTTINAILDVSKIETGQLALDYSPLQLRDVVEEPLSVLAPSALAKNLQLFSIVDPATPLHLLGDPLRLKQIVTNLLSNAIKFSNDGNIIIRITRVRSDAHGAMIKFSVEDSGIGISERQQPELFKAFSQADSSNARAQGGTGLGLAVCKGLVTKMGGDIGVDSTLGQGTTFWFTASLGLNNEAPFPRFDALRNKRAILCDNNPASVEQLIAYLQTWQMTCKVMSQASELAASIDSSSDDAGGVVIWNIDEQPEPRAWAASNPLCDSLIGNQQRALILLTAPGCDLDYRQNPQEREAVFLNRPVCHDQLYDTLCQQLDGIQAGDQTQAKSLSDAQRSRGPRIMAVDDNPANLQLIGELLKDLGAQVALAKDGSEALKLFQGETFDLIFMDIQMPVLDGLETTRRIRSAETGERRTPVVALTAHAMTDQKADLLLAGMDDYLNKPVSEAQLVHVIRRWIHSEVVSRPTVKVDDAPPPSERDTIGSPVDIQLSLTLSNNKPQLARDMLAMLLKALPQDLEAIENLFKQESFEELEACVHKLRGGASYCGVPRLKDASTALDNRLKNKSYDNLNDAVAELGNAIQQLIAWEADYDLDALFGLEEVGV